MMHEKNARKEERQIWKPEMATIWRNYFPPAKPLLSELAIFGRHISSQKTANPKTKLLILGATPEFRDLGFEYNCDVYCIERSKENFDLLKRLRRFTSDETLLLGDWQNSMNERVFDLIVGDTAINLLPPDCWKGLLDSFRPLLPPGGLLIHRFLVWHPEDIGLLGKFDEKEFAELLARSREEGKAFYPSVIFYLYRAFVDNNWSVSCRKWMTKIQEEHSRGTISDPEYESIKYLHYQADEEDFQIFIPPKSQVDAVLQERFEVTAIEHGDEFFPFVKNALIYAMRCK